MSPRASEQKAFFLDKEGDACVDTPESADVMFADFAAPLRWHVDRKQLKVLKKSAGEPRLLERWTGRGQLDPSPYHAAPRYVQNCLTPAQLASTAAPVLHQYAGVDLPLTQDTVPAQFNASMQVGEARRLGSGVASTTYAVTYEVDGKQVTMAFKPLGNQTNGSAGMSGICKDRPHLAERNLATRALAQRLKFDVVPHTTIGSARIPGDGKRGSEAIETAGVVMDMAPGQDGRHTPIDTFSDPEVRRELTKLQLLDFLTAQVDRHMHNYFVYVSQGKVRVTGIDNDASFGVLIQKPEQMLQGRRFVNRYFRGTVLPKIIDESMARAIKGLDFNDLDAILYGGRVKNGCKPYISSAELYSTKHRLALLHAYVDERRESGWVVDDDDWATPYIMGMYDEICGRECSYAVRDALHLMNKQRRVAEVTGGVV